MMRSMWSAVAGLKTHQLEMDVIGNNIANVNTTAYKSQATGFQDVLYQTVREGTGAGEVKAATNVSQVGLGSKLGSVYTNIAAQGSAITTNNAYDLMITGESFFQISTDGGQTVNYSRDGSFTIDAQGYLVTQQGYYVLGAVGNQNPEDARSLLQVIRTANVPDQTGKVGLRIDDKIAGTATSAGYFKGNLNSRDEALMDGGEGRTLRMEVFGTDGNKYTLKFEITHQEGDDTNVFNIAVTGIQKDDGTTYHNFNSNNTKLVYDKHNGKLTSPANVQFTFGGDASAVGPINIDFSNTSNFASNNGTDTSTIYAYKGDTQGLNKGFANGELTGLSFGTDGTIFGTYSNGQTIKKGQITTAVFSNAMGLEKVGDNLYAQSLNSGAAQVGDITRDGGYMQSGVLEGSNIDLAKEFTDMITTQRGFQANSRVITTSDEMLQILKGLKR